MAPNRIMRIKSSFKEKIAIHMNFLANRLIWEAFGLVGR